MRRRPPWRRHPASGSAAPWGRTKRRLGPAIRRPFVSSRTLFRRPPDESKKRTRDGRASVCLRIKRVIYYPRIRIDVSRTRAQGDNYWKETRDEPRRNGANGLFNAHETILYYYYHTVRNGQETRARENDDDV